MVSTSIWELVRHRAQADPQRVVVTDEHGQALTFAQLHERAESVAAGLHARGVRAGDVVSWQLPGRIDTVVLIAALCRLGAVQNPLIPMLRGKELTFICGQTGSRLLVVPNVFRGFDHLTMARSVATGLPGLDVLDLDAGLPTGDPASLPQAVAPQADQARWIFYTSGTTADPKGARHTDAGLIAASGTFCRNMQLVPDDRVAQLAPIAHVGGVLHLVSALSVGSRIVTSDVFDPASTPEQLEAAEVTIGGSGVPFLQVYLRRQAERPDRPFFGRARCFLVGGSTRTPALHTRVRDELGGVGLVSGYGMTECPYVSWGAIGDSDEHLATSEGRPAPEVRLKVLDEDGRPVAPGEPGELRVKAPQLMLGYVDASLDADAFDEDGFFRSGDIAIVDTEGYLTITGRIKDVIIRNMENISAREVEIGALTFPKVADLVAIGLPDADTGERVVAVAVPTDAQDPPTLEELTAHLRAQGLNPRKLPVQLELVPQLPRNAMGKVLKNQLKDDLRTTTR